MDSGELASMYAQIVNGKPKDQSRFVTDDESAQLWDEIEAEVAEIRQRNPNAHFSVPNEVPDVDDLPDQAEPTNEAGPAPDDDTGEDTEAEEPEPEPAPA